MAGLGHASEKEAIRYLGLTVLELGKAQRKVYDYIQSSRPRWSFARARQWLSTEERKNGK